MPDGVDESCVLPLWLWSDLLASQRAFLDDKNFERHLATALLLRYVQVVGVCVWARGCLGVPRSRRQPK